MFAIGWLLHRTVLLRMSGLEASLRAVTQGDLDTDIQTPDVREFRGVVAMLRAMRARLAFSEWQRREYERKAEEVRQETVEAMARKIESRSPAVRTVVNALAPCSTKRRR